jgi:hypothetical protein
MIKGEKSKTKKKNTSKNFKREDFKASTFSKYAGCIKEDYKEKNSVELAKNWKNYVD